MWYLVSGIAVNVVLVLWVLWLTADDPNPPNFGGDFHTGAFFYDVYPWEAGYERDNQRSSREEHDS